MDGTDQPSELDLRHDELNAFESAAGRRPVIHQQKDAGEYLDDEQEERHAAEVIPDGVAMERHPLVAEEFLESSPPRRSSSQSKMRRLSQP